MQKDKILKNITLKEKKKNLSRNKTKNSNRLTTFKILAKNKRVKLNLKVLKGKKKKEETPA